MKQYIDYFKYVMEHKINVFKVCWKKKMYIHAITHDLSKFLPWEFIPYAKWFYSDHGNKWGGKLGNKYDGKSYYDWEFTIHNKLKYDFDKAWEHHYKHNKHHWDYWTGLQMPVKHIREMICDWEAMSMKFGGTAQEYYLKNYNKIKLTTYSRVTLEYNLDLIPSLNAAYSEGNWEVHEPIKHVIEYYSKTEYGRQVLETELFTKIDKKYNVNTLKYIEESKE